MKSRFFSLSLLTLIAVGVAACSETNPSAPPATGGVSSDIQGSAQEPSASPLVSTAPETPAPSASESASTAPTPGTQAIGVSTIRGKVYDQSGATLSSGQVRVRSLNPSAPFDSTVDVLGGNYVVNSVPAGVSLEVTALRSGWTSRSQVTTALPLMRNVEATTLNFGGGTNPYFLSNYPEISAIDPVSKASNVDPTKLTVKLTLSEPLDATNRRRLERALRVIPANAAANGGALGTTSDLEAQEDNGGALNLLIPYQVRSNSLFMEEEARMASVGWSADGREATLSFDAPMITDQNDEAKYQVVLISDGERITDGSGNQLGTNEAGSLASYPARDQVIRSVFKPESLAIKTVPGLSAGSKEAAWAATHNNMSVFKVAKDKAAPTLVSVGATNLGKDTRIALTFSEPMAAYNGTVTGLTRGGVLNLANYSFAIGETAADLESTKLDGIVDPGQVIDPRVRLTYSAESDWEREFRFNAAAFAADRATAATGQVAIEVDPLDAKRVLLTIVGVQRYFGTEASAIKARAEGVQDPAGNAITGSSADRRTVVGRL
jgi:hypothetical protein